jgi:hypothetical protein
MDDMEKGYDNDMYGSDDFNQIKNKVHYSVCHGEAYTMIRHKEWSKNKVHYSVCHGEGYTMIRHKEWPKRNRRACGTMGRNRRSGATDIIKVMHTSNMKINIFVGM